MKNAHCQMTVAKVVTAHGGIMKSVAPTKAEIELSDGVTRDVMIEAVKKAGYLVEKT